MTRSIKRNSSLSQPRKKRRQDMDHMFWQALLAVHDAYFEDALHDYAQRGRPCQHIYHQLCTLTCWLDVAIEQKWLDEDESGE